MRAEPTIEKAGGDRPSVIRAFTDYVRDVRVEMSKVSWPSQRDLRDSTLVVIVMVILVSIFIGIVDRLLSIGFEALIKMLG